MTLAGILIGLLFPLQAFLIYHSMKKKRGAD
jgi:hypothetical protein